MSFALHDAVRNRDAPCICDLLTIHDGSALDASGQTALDVATASDDAVDCVLALLLGSGVRADRKDGQGTTALWRAVRQGRPAIAAALVQHQPALVNDTRTKDAASPLWIAARFGSLEMAEILLNSGVVHVDARDLEQHATPLYMAVVYARDGEVRIVHLLLASGARSDAVDRDGVSVLQAALQRPTADMVDAILAHPQPCPEARMLQAIRDGLSATSWDRLRSDPDTLPFTDDRHLLITATQCGSVDSVDFLLMEKNFSVDLRRLRDGGTALHAAVIGRHAELVNHLMVTHHADPCVQDNAGMSPLYHAARRGLQAIATIITTLAPRCVDVATPEGFTPLISAARRGYVDIVRLLLDSGADPNGSETDGTTVLMGAAAMGRTDVVSLLLRRTANVKAVNASGRSALEVAVGDDVVTILRRALALIFLYRDRFEIHQDDPGRTIRGLSSVVLLAHDTADGGAGSPVAIKLCSDADARDNTRRMLTLLRGIHVAPLVEIGEVCFDDPVAYPATPFAVVMSAGGATLQHILDSDARLEVRRPENETRAIFEGIASSVRHLHDHGIVHGDLKAGNCVRFPPDGRLRLIDFDEARLLSDRLPAGRTTPEICPPDVARALLGSSKMPPASKASDMWALGCLLFHLVVGVSFISRLLEEDRDCGDPGDVSDTVRALSVLSTLDSGRVASVLDPVFAEGGTMRGHAVSLMRKLLEPNAAKRCKMEALIEHAFMKGGLTATMHDQGLAGLRAGQVTLLARQEVTIDLVNEVLDGVRRLEDRTLNLLDLHADLLKGFADLGRRMGGLRDVVVGLADLGCPTTFIIVPDMPVRQWYARRDDRADLVVKAAGDMATDMEGVATNWADDLMTIFTRSDTVARLVERFSHHRFRLKLVCDKCPTLCEPGYLIEKASPALAHLLPALQMSLKVLRVLNVGMCIARCFFPVVPVLPDGFNKRFESMLQTIGAKNSASKFAIISRAVDAADAADKETKETEKTKDDAASKNVRASAHQLRAFLKIQDPTNTWGGLTRIVLAETDGPYDSSSPTPPVVWCCSHCVQAHGHRGNVDTVQSVVDEAHVGKVPGILADVGRLTDEKEEVESEVEGEAEEMLLQGAVDLGCACFGIRSKRVHAVTTLK